MKNSTFSKRVRQDCRLLRRTLFKLFLPRFVRWSMLIALAVAGGVYIAFQILAFGATVDYRALHTLGASTVAFLNRFNPYLWWGVILVWAWIIFVVLRNGLRRSLDQVRLKPVRIRVMTFLVEDLCAEVVEVMRWCWDNRDEPFSVGDLQRTIGEIRQGRIAKIALIRKQERVLGSDAASSVEQPVAPIADSPIADKSVWLNRGHESEAREGEARSVLLRRDPSVESRSEPHLAPIINLPS